MVMTDILGLEPSAFCIYGVGGAGKTATAISSFWDWKTMKPVEREGRPVKALHVSFGRENNPTLRIPKEYRSMGEQSLRFTAPLLDSLDWLKEFHKAMVQIYKAAKNGNCLDVLVIDGLTELGRLDEETYRNIHATSKDKFAPFNELNTTFLSTMQILDPEELGCHVISTARVMSRKEDMTNSEGRVISVGDPDWIKSDNYPALRGSFRKELISYLHYILFIEQTEVINEGAKQLVHRLHLIQQGNDFLVRNNVDDRWTADTPKTMDNPRFWDIVELLAQVESAGLKVPA